MKKTFPVLLVLFSLLSCNGGEMISDPTVQDPSDIEYPAEDLSSGGTSNCYLVSHSGEYSFDASVRGNGRQTEGLALPEALTPVSAKLVWQSAPGMVESLDLDGTRVRFTLSGVRGNALVGVCDAAGEIIWSWHIWFPKQMPTAIATACSLGIMDMNLGAMSSERGLDAYGLLYQWGRKDPFPGSPLASGGSVNTVNSPVYDIDGNEVKIKASEMYSNKDNTLAFSIAHPETCLSRGKTGTNDWLLPAESNSAFWGNPKGAECGGDGKYLNNGSKSFYDPCPPGWRVAPPAVFADFTESGQYAWVNLDATGMPLMTRTAIFPSLTSSARTVSMYATSTATGRLQWVTGTTAGFSTSQEVAAISLRLPGMTAPMQCLWAVWSDSGGRCGPMRQARRLTPPLHIPH